MVEIELPPPHHPVEYMDVTRYFPHGAFSARVTTVPGTNLQTGTHYRIYVGMHSAPAPVNRFFLDRYAIPWSGNVLIVRYQQIVGSDTLTYGRMQKIELSWCTTIVVG